MREYNQKFNADIDDILIPVGEWTRDLQGRGFWRDAGSAYWMKDGYINRTDDPFDYDPQDATHVLWYNK